MSSPLPPVPGPISTDDKGRLTPPWQAWFLQLYNYLSSPASGGGGIVPVTRNVNTTLPLTGGGALGADLTLGVNAFGAANSGVVPASGGLSTTFLAGDGTWQIITGATGPAGPQGLQGVATYLEGDIGEQGEVGPPGPPGPQGNPGIGIQGLPGVPLFLEAAEGEPGQDGIPGPQGLQGAAGSVGSQGAPGVPIFLEAAEGDAGDIGPPGAAGAVGATGATGVQGAPGAVGPAVFLEAEMADAEYGPPGPAGPQGNPGSQGVAGAGGPPGPAIFLEAEMVEGDQGPPGIPGAAGAAGAAGTNGTQGPPGAAIFLEAPEGEPGADGFMMIPPSVPYTITVGGVAVNNSTIPANGMYLSAANTLSFSAGSTQAASVNSANNWVFNAPTSGQALTITSYASTEGIRVKSSTANGTAISLIGNNGTGTIYYLSATGSTNLFTISANGGTDPSSPALSINSASIVSLQTTNITNLNLNGTSVPVNGLYNPSSNALGFATNTTLRATLDSSGNFLVGSTTLPTDLTTNTASLTAGLHRSASMTTASTASGTAVTIFAIPANATGVYLVQATLSAVAAASLYTVVGILVTNAASYKWTNIVTATNMTVAVSGSNLQATQTSGAAQVITATATRFA